MALPSAAEIAYAITRMNNTAYKYDLGKLVHGGHTVLGTYSFTRDGGAVSDINLKDVNGNALVLPSGALIRNVTMHATTALTSGGSATIDLNAEAANDCAAAVAKATLSLNAVAIGIPDFATVADYVRLTADRTITISINTAALTAGAINVWIDYLFG